MSDTTDPRATLAAQREDVQAQLDKLVFDRLRVQAIATDHDARAADAEERARGLVSVITTPPVGSALGPKDEDNDYVAEFAQELAVTDMLPAALRRIADAARARDAAMAEQEVLASGVLQRLDAEIARLDAAPLLLAEAERAQRALDDFVAARARMLTLAQPFGLDATLGNRVILGRAIFACDPDLARLLQARGYGAERLDHFVARSLAGYVPTLMPDTDTAASSDDTPLDAA